VDAVSEVPRFEPHSGWAALPVQPPSGTWQLRLARMYPALIVNFVLLVPAALTGHQYFVIGVLFWILGAGFILQGVFLIVVGIRATQLERRERKLGYTTWARKR
jgi:membrane protein YdbS with pleckstrin-like domain